MGVTEGAVSQWVKRATEEGGVEALKKRTSPGAPPRLSENQRLQLERLPGYAPDLNPDEGISASPSEVCGAKEPLLPESLRELKVELRKAKERLRHKRDVILGCIRQPGFDFEV